MSSIEKEISQPKLPWKKGYTVVMIDGVETYKRVDAVEEKVKLSEALSEAQAENKLLKAQLQAQSDRADFIEDCIAEMAVQVYGGV